MYHIWPNRDAQSPVATATSAMEAKAKARSFGVGAVAVNFYDEVIYVVTPQELKRFERSLKASESRKVREQLLRDCGLTKVKGSVSGRTYWE